MNKTKVGLIGFGIVLAFIITFVVAAYVNAHNTGIMFETRIKASWDSNRVVLNSYTTKVQETAQVPTMFRDDLGQIIEQTFQGRYGADGSQAVFQWIQEQNMSLDPMLYRQIQQVMESGRNEFRMSQQQLIDVKAAYQAELDYFVSGFWLGMAGFPRIDLDKYNVVVLADVDVKFETGQDQVIQLR